MPWLTRVMWKQHIKDICLSKDFKFDDVSDRKSDMWGKMEKVRVSDLTKIRTGKLDANASSEDGKYPFFTCSKEPLRISTYTYDCECVLVAGNGDLNVKYYNGKFDAYQRTYIIEDNSNG